MVKLLLAFAGGLVWLLTASIAFGDFFQKGLDAYNMGDYENALIDFELSARENNPEAQHYLGFMHYEGLGTNQSPTLAAKWFGLAAKQGDKRAQYNLGFMYYRGHGVGQSYREAAKWYRHAAEQGDKRAQYNLGFMYYRARGVRKNYRAAAKWYRHAAEQGDKRAQYNLGLMYVLGQGVAKDPALAHMWLSIAIASGNGPAYEVRAKIAQNMSRAQQQKAEKLFKDCTEKQYQNCR